MNKVVILGDMHIGARGANTIVMEHQIKFFEEVLFPHMEKHGIKTILQLGDVFDTRKFTNHLVLYEWKERVFQYMEDNEINFITLIGNHDSFYKNTLKVNSIDLFLRQYSNIKIIYEPRYVPVGDVEFFLVPWICDDNADRVIDVLNWNNALFCAGHFEFAGFEMHPGHVMETGIDHTTFKRFDKVFSGHYHTRTQKDNVEYIGTPYELTWIDFEDPKGFTVFDTKTLKTEFIRNEKSLFVKIHYNDKDKDTDYWKTIACANVTGSFVKLVVINKTDPYQFDKIVEKITSLSPEDLKILDELDDFTDIEIDDEVEVEDTPALIESFIEKVETSLEKDRITNILKNLYLEAISLPI